MNIKENYQQYVSRYATEVAALKRKNTGIYNRRAAGFRRHPGLLDLLFRNGWGYTELSVGGGAVPDCLSGNQTT